MKEAIKVSYDGVEIEYLENSNEWRFELRGRERLADSLANAKAAIDKADPKPKPKKSVEPIFGFMGANYRDSNWREVKVTSIAERGYGSSMYVWISEGGKRSMEVLSNIYAITEKNLQIRAEIDQAVAESERWESTAKKLREGLSMIDISSFTESAS